MSQIITRAEFWVKHAAIGAASPHKRDDAAYTALHREYWGAYVKVFNLSTIFQNAPRLIEQCKKALAAGDTSFNSPYTQLIDWDNYQGVTAGRFGLKRALYDNGEGWSLSVNICLLKEAMLQKLEEEAI